eukprot:817009-Pyramimonas_sp.AAC.1
MMLSVAHWCSAVPTAAHCRAMLVHRCAVLVSTARWWSLVLNPGQCYSLQRSACSVLAHRCSQPDRCRPPFAYR